MKRFNSAAAFRTRPHPAVAAALSSHERRLIEDQPDYGARPPQFHHDSDTYYVRRERREADSTYRVITTCVALALVLVFAAALLGAVW